MAHCRIKSHPRTDQESSSFPTKYQLSHIQFLNLFRVQDQLQCLFCIFRDPHASCKIITRSGRNISKRYFRRIFNSIDHFIQGPIPAKHNHRMLFLICCDLSCDPFRIFFSAGHSDFIGDPPFFQFRLKLTPQQLSLSCS